MGRGGGEQAERGLADKAFPGLAPSCAAASMGQRARALMPVQVNGLLAGLARKGMKHALLSKRPSPRRALPSAAASDECSASALWAERQVSAICHRRTDAHTIRQASWALLLGSAVHSYQGVRPWLRQTTSASSQASVDRAGLRDPPQSFLAWPTPCSPRSPRHLLPAHATSRPADRLAATGHPQRPAPSMWANAPGSSSAWVPPGPCPDSPDTRPMALPDPGPSAPHQRAALVALLAL